MATSNGHKGRETAATDHIATMAHDTVDVIAERAQRAEREVRGTAARAAKQAHQLQDEAAERAEQTLRRAGSYVETNPLAFAGIAFVAGALVATLLRR